jgi:hypothetical protein
MALPVIACSTGEASAGTIEPTMPLPAAISETTRILTDCAFTMEKSGKHFRSATQA